jgi:hypothetical protein
MRPTMTRGAPNAPLLRAGWVGDTTPCECSADPCEARSAPASRSPSTRRMPTPTRSLRARDASGVPQLFDSVRGASATPRLDASRRTHIGIGTIRGSATRAGRASRPTQAEQETVLRWDREGDYVHVWSASPVTGRKLSTGSASSRSGRRSVRRGLGAVLRHPRQPIPLAVQAGWDPGARTACSGQERGVDVNSDSSEPPTRSPYRSWANHARTAHLAPEAGSR